jgi:hypothetical protein
MIHAVVWEKRAATIPPAHRRTLHPLITAGLITNALGSVIRFC